MSKKKKKEEKSVLEADQMKFIKKKVVELGSYREVCAFYRLKDLVTEFAREEGRRVYKIDVLTDDDEFKPPRAPREKKTPKEQPNNVKRKRKIDVDEVLADDEKE